MSHGVQIWICDLGMFASRYQKTRDTNRGGVSWITLCGVAPPPPGGLDPSLQSVAPTTNPFGLVVFGTPSEIGDTQSGFVSPPGSLGNRANKQVHEFPRVFSNISKLSSLGVPYKRFPSVSLDCICWFFFQLLLLGESRPQGPQSVCAVPL